MDVFKESPIHINYILLAMMTRPNNRSNFYTPARTRDIYSTTRMLDSTTYETLGDAVYDVLFYNYVWSRGIPIDIYLAGRSKSNITMSRLMERSPMYKYVRMTQKYLLCKSVADVFESSIGVIYDHLISNDQDISLLYTWMRKVFDIDTVFYNLVYRRTTPSGSTIRRSPRIDILHLYRSAIQKLASVYYLFLKNKYNPKACTIIHDLYLPYVDIVDARVISSLDYVIGSNDPLAYIPKIQDDISILFN